MLWFCKQSVALILFKRGLSVISYKTGLSAFSVYSIGNYTGEANSWYIGASGQKHHEILLENH